MPHSMWGLSLLTSSDLPHWRSHWKELYLSTACRMTSGLYSRWRLLGFLGHTLMMHCAHCWYGEMISMLCRRAFLLLCLIFRHSLTSPTGTHTLGTFVDSVDPEDAPAYHCVNESQWTAANFHPSDCWGALYKLRRLAKDSGGELFEFVATGIRPSHRSLKTIYTPRKFRSGDFHIMTRRNSG